ncbi:OLC1v1008865C1 [Oldenlandia corymbosa var. corymbosa]|uniref:OLC1v1008865C1 n=1 Tax=Oldenlandia corymbosa var. corymbosa TaxID=529605 RepID=A0AAV1DML9_OLDCO|nr:OLC1v1008865C1 [Oldenlandia corymbosa var. corymbosa]
MSAKRVLTLVDELATSSRLSAKEKEAIVDVQDDFLKTNADDDFQLIVKHHPPQQNSSQPSSSPPAATVNHFALLETIQEEENETPDADDDDNVEEILAEKPAQTESNTLEEERQALLRLGDDVPLRLGKFSDDAEVGTKSGILDEIDGGHGCWSESDVGCIPEEETVQGDVSESRKRHLRTKAEMAELGKGVILRRQASQRHLKVLIKIIKVELVFIMEPMLLEHQIKVIKRELGFDLAFSSITSKIWVFCKAGFSLCLLENTEQFIHFEDTHISVPTKFLLSAVYAKSKQKGRHALWQNMATFSKVYPTEPWLIGGDFNVIRTLEVFSGHSVQDLQAMADFNECIQEYAPLKIRAIGEEFTWGGSSLENLSRTTSDHCPMLYLFNFPIATKPRVFRFQKMWLRRAYFMALVQEDWKSPMELSGMLGFSLKLKHLKARVLANPAEIEQEAINFFHALLNEEDVDPYCEEKQVVFLDSKRKTSWNRVSKIEARGVVHTKVLIRRGNSSFWFDSWSSFGALWDVEGSHPPFPNLVCLLCKNGGDGIGYCFYGCQFAKQIWNHFSVMLNININGVLSIASIVGWWWNGGDFKTAFGMLRKLLPSLILWEIWKCRNKAIFEAVHPNVTRVINAMKDQVRCLMILHDLKLRSEREKMFFSNEFQVEFRKYMWTRVFRVAWNRPPANCFVLNSDGSSCLTGAGYGFVIRGQGGSFLVGECRYLGKGDSFLAEILGVLFGLRKCEQLHLQNVEVQTDNKVLSEAFIGGVGFPWKYLSHMQEMQSLLQ